MVPGVDCNVDILSFRARERVVASVVIVSKVVGNTVAGRDIGSRRLLE